MKIRWFVLLGAGLALLAPAMVSAQFVTTIPNTTNACIIETYKSYSPNLTNPSTIVIDRRLVMEVNPMTVCTTSVVSNANCNRDPNGGPGGEPLLAAIATSGQFSLNPRCVWNCAGAMTMSGATCGTITTDNSRGLPVELLEFGGDDI